MLCTDSLSMEITLESSPLPSCGLGTPVTAWPLAWGAGACCWAREAWRAEPGGCAVTSKDRGISAHQVVLLDNKMQVWEVAEEIITVHHARWGEYWLGFSWIQHSSASSLLPRLLSKGLTAQLIYTIAKVSILKSSFNAAPSASDTGLKKYKFGIILLTFLSL